MESGSNQIVPSKKVHTSMMDKISQTKSSDSLVDWATLYFEFHVVGSPEKTIAAKKQDLSKFLSFFSQNVGHPNVDGWTPAVTKKFLMDLSQIPLPGTGTALKATSINRILATLRHFASWVDKQRPFVAGHPFVGVKNLHTDEPAWNGLDNKEIMRLRSACEQREKICSRENQNPLLESAVFYVLLHTGMRAAELASLNREQYHHRGFHHVRRKGSRVSTKIACPLEAREKLDAYLMSQPHESGALFVSRFGNRLKTLDVARICERIANQANAHLPQEEHIKLTPHMLRHTFLKRIADKNGVHVAQKMSGNISMREVFRYTKPSAQEIEDFAEGAFKS